MSVLRVPEVAGKGGFLWDLRRPTTHTTAGTSPATRACPNQHGHLSWASRPSWGAIGWRWVLQLELRYHSGELEAGLQHGHSKRWVPGSLDQLLALPVRLGPVLHKVLSQGQPPWCHQKSPPSACRAQELKKRESRNLDHFKELSLTTIKLIPHK